MDRDPRRGFLVAASALLAAPLTVDAQQPAKLRRLGYLAFNNATSGGHILATFRQALGELGWIDGKHIIIETRFANGEVARLPSLANELLSLNIDLMVAGSSASTHVDKAPLSDHAIPFAQRFDWIWEMFQDMPARNTGSTSR